MKTGVKVLIGLRVLIKGKHRTSIEHVRDFISFPHPWIHERSVLDFEECLGWNRRSHILGDTWRRDDRIGLTRNWTEWVCGERTEDDGDGSQCGGYDFGTGALFFTHNGVRLPNAFVGIYMPRMEYATIDFKGANEVEVNFGSPDFL
jgi:hypothetical protein